MVTGGLALALLSGCTGGTQPASSASSDSSSQPSETATSPTTAMTPTPTAPATSHSTTPPPQPSAAQSHPADDALHQVTPVISFAGAGTVPGTFGVSGYVDGVVEEGGMCTATLTKGTTSMQQTRSASADASSTACGEVTFKAGAVGSGTWAATLAYSSSTSRGESAPVEVVVP